jgi:hypothetical protein
MHVLNTQSNILFFLQTEIIRLQGEVVQTYDPKVTHFISAALQKTEKFLAACAACIPMVHAKYVEDSYESGRWLSVDDYLYNRQNADRLNITKNELLDAAHMCSNRKKKPFHDWCVEMHASDTYFKKFGGIFSAGGAVVLDRNFTTPQTEPTIVVFHKDTPTNVKQHLWNTYGALGAIPVVNVEYVFKYLIDPQSDMKPFMLKDPSIKSTKSKKRKNIDSGSSGSSDMDNTNTSRATKKQKR